MVSLSTHVLDTASGEPAAGVRVELGHRIDGGWSEVGSGVTDSDGRIGDLGSGLDPGSYRLRFDTQAYGNDFFPEVLIAVNLDGGRSHYHIPLLLSPYGYSTYRGS